MSSRCNLQILKRILAGLFQTQNFFFVGIQCMSLIALFHQHLFVSALEERRSVPGRNELPFLLRYGVPQRSCLGPLLFTIYASKLFEILERHLSDVHVYADDKQLYLSFKPGSTVSELEAVTALQNCIIDIKT